MKLQDALNFEKLVVTSINTDYKRKKHLENLGLIKNSNIQSLYNYGGQIIIKIKDGRLAIDNLLARLIEVNSKEENRSLLLLNENQFVRKINDDLQEYKYQIDLSDEIINLDKESKETRDIKRTNINLKKRDKFIKKVENLESKYFSNISKIKEKDVKLINNLSQTTLKLNNKLTKLNNKLTKTKDIISYTNLQNKIESLNNKISLFTSLSLDDLNKVQQLTKEDFKIWKLH